VDLVDFVFPTSVLPFKVDDEFLDKCRDALKDTEYVWCNGHENTSETQLAAFLNTICEAIAIVSGKQILREWDANYCNTPLSGSPIRRKPDVVLLDRDFEGTPKWQNIHAVAELTTSKHEHHRIIRTVTDKTYILLGVQPNRVFVPIISAWGGSKFRLTVTDRQGQLRTKTFNIEDGVRRADLRTLIHILAGLCFGRDKAIGYDETMIMGRDGVEAIFCSGKEFKVTKLVFASQSLIGRATRVWIVNHNNRQFVLKDSWIEQSRPVSEVEHLKKVAGIEGVPKLFCAEDIPGLSTGNLRLGINGDKDRERLRRRIVTSSCGSLILQVFVPSES
jgi:Fungal protein kinase